MERIRKMPTEKEMLEKLLSGALIMAPLSLRPITNELPGDRNSRFDAYIEASWKGKKAKFAVECKSISTPKAFQQGTIYLKASPLPKGYWPLLYLPFLNADQLKTLEKVEISGIDMCGNGFVIVPDKFAVFRTGMKNLFSTSTPIKNIYRMSSSMAARIFLVIPSFDSVSTIQGKVNSYNILARPGAMSLSTVSKVLKVLEEDLIIERSSTIRLLQADKLLDKLCENYGPPKVTKRLRLRVPEQEKSVQSLVGEQAGELRLVVVATGKSSVSRYAVMQRDEPFSIYCPRSDLLVSRLNVGQSDRFPNLEIVETEDERVYFDAQRDAEFWWSSPIQVYLELMSGDKRDKETAVQVRSLLIAQSEKQ